MEKHRPVADPLGKAVYSRIQKPVHASVTLTKVTTKAQFKTANKGLCKKQKEGEGAQEVEVTRSEITPSRH
ncbi:hypothetical protein TcWFU_003334 [Taenia crassiceps]|uniref:60S ribosomal protein L6 n=1 Tax=Taenia crassiceps TaxID=6207 RepID=A0ABR4Q438_9CEST